MTVLERRLANLFRHNPDCQKVADIPGVGLLTATATVAAIGVDLHGILTHPAQ
jgi:transposase